VDVSRVPVYPVLRLELDARAGEVSGMVNGSLVARGAEATVREGVLEEAARQAALRPARAIRVRLTGFGDQESAVVTARGELVVPPRRRRRQSPRVKFVAVLAVVAVAVSGAVAGLWYVASWAKARQAASAPAPAAPAGSGLEQWKTEVGGGLTGGGVSGGPVVLGQGRVVVWTTDRLVAISGETGALQDSWALDSELSQVAAVGGGVVVTGQGQHARVLGATGGLEDRVIPAGALPVGVLGGRLAAAGSCRAWLIDSATVAGEGTVLEAPAGTTWAGVVGVVDDQLVAAFTPDDASTMVLRAFTVGSWHATWSTPAVPAGPLVSPGSSPPLTVSPDGTWGVYGSTVVDLVSGGTHALPPDWTTTAVGQALAFGVSSGRVLAVSKAGAVAAATDGAPAVAAGQPVGPVGVTDSGSAVIVASDGGRRGVYVVAQLAEGSR